MEPEPDCYLETTQETIEFFSELFRQYCHLHSYIGICFDTCHIAIQFEDIYQSLLSFKNSNIKIAKVQLSSALSLNAEEKIPQEVLLPFAEEVYLHQTKVKEGEQVYSFVIYHRLLKHLKK